MYQNTTIEHYNIIKCEKKLILCRPSPKEGSWGCTGHHRRRHLLPRSKFQFQLIEIEIVKLMNEFQLNLPRQLLRLPLHVRRQYEPVCARRFLLLMLAVQTRFRLACCKYRVVIRAI